MLDPGSDPLGRLAGLLRRPRESLTAFSRLEPHQLTFLADAIEAAFARRTHEVDVELTRMFSPQAAPHVARLLRGYGFPSLKDLLNRRA